MDLKERPSSENWTMPFTMFGSQQQQKWDDPSTLDYSTRIPPSFSKTNQPCKNSSLLNGNPNTQTKITNQEEDQMNQMMLGTARTQDWDPRAMLNNLSFMEQKIHQLQELIHMIVPGSQDELVTQQQQQLITADLTSIIVQLISTAGSLLPTVNHNLSAANPSATQLNAVTEVNCNTMEEEHQSKDDDDGKEEHLLPGSYSILQLEKEEILAPHTHFCTICGKGFKRDANLRMHMRGHGDEYKTPAALAKPNKESTSEQMILKRYSCPVVGCKRNKDHNKFQPLKSILCVKNHYKRTHCDKSYICSRCHTKKFSVIADLKTHEKHCGRDKWLCSCGTTFSRKDKLFGHIALFQGHTPAIPLAENSEGTDKVANVEIGNGVNSLMDVTGNAEDPYLSLLNYGCSLGGIQDFPQANFDDSSSPFSFLISGEKSGVQSGTNDMD